MQIHAKDMKHVTVTEPPNSGPDSSESDNDLRQLAPPPVKIQRKILSKQLSMCETKRERAWEKRRMQILRRNNSNCGFDSGDDSTDGFRSPRFHGSNLTDEDMSELKGSIELGFGFNEEDGQDLCETLPALDLYFAVNRQYSDGKHGSSSPVSILGSSYSSTSASPKSPNNDSWKIFSRGDKPQHVKTRLRHWAQAVACSVRQCY